ncbi:MAG: hypothetical protein L6R39_002217 [Caloplaca ligustica]|nr:MAG: hypothetical protein L6R39_002217 [Caloplaca ligustica]
MYSECSSSSSSFSYGLLTPTSSADFSGAPSRRQSIASEVQSCNESAFDRMPSFSSERVFTPLETPPPSGLSVYSDTFSSMTQAYETERTPIGVQGRRGSGQTSTSNGIRLQTPSSSRGPCFQPASTPEFDLVVRGSRPMEKSLMNWAATFNNGYDQDYDHLAEALGFDPSAKSDFEYINPDLFTAPEYLGYGMSHEAARVANSPQTVSPQETVVCPMTSFVPTTPVCQPLEAPFQTPVVKSENPDRVGVADDPFSPCDSLSNGERPSRRAPNVRERRQTISSHVHRPARSESRGSKRKRSQSFEFVGNIKVTHFSSSTKPHRCEECGLRFYRPEHRKRHEKSETHINQCIKLGVPIPYDGDPKPFKCQVPGCKTRVTRHDNLRPHYQKTHFFDRYVTKDGKIVLKDGKPVENRKRNKYVSPEDAEKMGEGHIDPRTERGRAYLKSSRTAKLQFSEDSDE